MTNDSNDTTWPGPTITRRAAVATVGSIIGLSVSGVATADQTSGGSSVAISSATQVGGTQMFIGPDSVKSNVSQQAGRVYRATDTQVEYYSDGQQWVKFGVGSTQESVPQVNTDKFNNTVHFVETSETPQDVFNNAAAGDTVAFLPGTHTVTGSFGIETTLSNLTIELLPGAVVEHGNGEATGSAQYESAVFRIGDGGSTTIRNVTIKGEGIIDGNRNSQLAQSTGILLDNDCNHCDIYNIEIRNMSGSGIWTEGNTTRNFDFGVHGVYVHDTDKDGVLAKRTDVFVVDQDFLIENAKDQDGLEASNCNHVRFKNGRVRDAAGGLVDIFADCNDVEISGLQLEHDTRDTPTAIQLSSSLGDPPSNVHIHDCQHEVTTTSQDSRFLLMDQGEVRVEDCQSKGAGTRPLDINGGSLRCESVQLDQMQNQAIINIPDATFINCEMDAGMFLGSAANNTLIKGGVFQASSGIVIDATNGPDSITIRDAEIAGAASDHVRIDGGAGPHRVIGVTSENAGQTGIEVRNVPVIIRGCDVFNASGDGIKPLVNNGTTVENVKICNNRVSGCGAQGIQVIESSTSDTFDFVQIRNNHVNGNAGAGLDDQSSGANKDVAGNIGV